MSQVLVCDFCDKLIDERSDKGYCPFTVRFIAHDSEERFFHGHAHIGCTPPQMLQLVDLRGKWEKTIEQCEAPPELREKSSWQPGTYLIG